MVTRRSIVQVRTKALRIAVCTFAVAVLSQCARTGGTPLAFSPGTWCSADGAFELTLDADGTAPLVRLEMYPADRIQRCLEAWPPSVETQGTWSRVGGYSEVDLATVLAPTSYQQVFAGADDDWRELVFYPCGPDYDAIVLLRVADTEK